VKGEERLAGLEILGEVADTLLAAAQPLQQPETGLVAEGPEEAVRLVLDLRARRHARHY